MKMPLWFVVLAAGAAAAPQLGAVAELLELLGHIRGALAEGAQNWRIETPLHIDTVNCMNKIFEGTELLKNKLDMEKYSVFFQKFERLKQSLTLYPGEEEECDTERKHPRIFIEKLTTFIRKCFRSARAPSY